MSTDSAPLEAASLSGSGIDVVSVVVSMAKGSNSLASVAPERTGPGR